jgi:hypothetical protein
VVLRYALGVRIERLLRWRLRGWRGSRLARPARCRRDERCRLRSSTAFDAAQTSPVDPPRIGYRMKWSTSLCMISKISAILASCREQYLEMKRKEYARPQG